MQRRTFLTAFGLSLLAVPLAGRVVQSKGEIPAFTNTPEVLTGTILLVDRGKNLLIVQDSAKVPFDFVITPKTDIEVDGKRATLDALGGLLNRNVSVTFTAKRDGNFAHKILAQ